MFSGSQFDATNAFSSGGFMASQSTQFGDSTPSPAKVDSWTLELVLVNWVLFGFVQGELVRALGGVVASTSLLGVLLGHNSLFLQGPAFAPPMIRQAIWCGSTNSTTEEGI
ncbi:hypothetical protein FF1_022560 [Malus domestica]